MATERHYSEWTDTRTVTVPASGEVGEVQGFAGVPEGDDAVRWSWDALPEAAGYQLLFDEEPAEEPDDPDDPGDPDDPDDIVPPPADGNWTLAFNEDWSQGIRWDDVWTAYTYSMPSTENFRGGMTNNFHDDYSLEEQAEVVNGVCVITAERNPITVNGRTYPWRACTLTTDTGGFSFRTNVYIECRLRTEGNGTVGFWPSFWTWQQPGSPSDNEVDVWEHWSTDRPIRYYTNGRGAINSPGAWVNYSTLPPSNPGAARPDQWHTYGAHIGSNFIRYYFDGELQRHANMSSPPNHDMGLIFNLWSDINHNPPVDSWRLYVDYVRAWFPA